MWPLSTSVALVSLGPLGCLWQSAPSQLSWPHPPLAVRIQLYLLHLNVRNWKALWFADSDGQFYSDDGAYYTTPLCTTLTATCKMYLLYMLFLYWLWRQIPFRTRMPLQGSPVVEAGSAFLSVGRLSKHWYHLDGFGFRSSLSSPSICPYLLLFGSHLLNHLDLSLPMHFGNSSHLDSPDV